MRSLFARATVAAAVFVAAVLALAQPPAPGTPPDPWPRVIDLSNAQVLMYQPQVTSWVDNRMEMRAALAMKSPRDKSKTFGASGHVARAGTYNTHTGQRSYGSSVSAAGAGGSSIDRNTAATAGPLGYARGASTTTYNTRTGQTNSWQSASVGNNHYADVNGNVYRNTGSGW
jgi:hypothetical protein